MRGRGWLGLGVLFLATAAQAKPLVWCFTDSIGGFFCPLVASAHPEWTVVDYHQGGERTDAGKTRLAGLYGGCPAPHPDVVLIEEGINDLVARDNGACGSDPTYSPDEVVTNLTTMAALVANHGGVPIIATPLYTCPESNPDPILQCFFDDACVLRDDILVGFVHTVDFALPDADFIDLLHPNPAGATILADQAGAAISAVLP